MRKFNEKMAAFFRQLYVDEQKVLVFGEGEQGAELMLIGEAPGEQETRTGRPFVGKAGKNLDEFLSITGLERSDMYITNVVKFRPAKISNAGRLVNRPPSAEEVKLSLPWLEQEIELINPGLIVTLGNVPLKALMGREASVGRSHGQWLMWRGIRLYSLYHPASVIYNRSLDAVYRDDVARLTEAVRPSDD